VTKMDYTKNIYFHSILWNSVQNSGILFKPLNSHSIQKNFVHCLKNYDSLSLAVSSKVAVDWKKTENRGRIISRV